MFLNINYEPDHYLFKWCWYLTTDAGKFITGSGKWYISEERAKKAAEKVILARKERSALSSRTHI